MLEARRFDLHLHTSRSDGQHPPDEVLVRCAKGGLDVVAITDHDIAPPFRAGVHEVDGRAIRVIAGVEASGMHDGAELHLLVYFPGDVPDAFRAFTQAQVSARVERYETGRLALEVELPPADAAARSGERALTRHHLARALVAAGACRDIREAFARFLHEGAGNVPKVQVAAGEVIDAAHTSGAVVSWAHPTRDQSQRHLEGLVKLGLDGVEGIRPRASSADRRFFRNAAKRHGLFVTGGSDWHGWYEGEPGLFAVERAEIAAFVERIGA